MLRIVELNHRDRMIFGLEVVEKSFFRDCLGGYGIFQEVGVSIEGCPLKGTSKQPYLQRVIVIAQPSLKLIMPFICRT